MREYVHPDGGIVLINDDDTDEVIVEAVVDSFSPIRGASHCVCGAPLQPWSWRRITADSIEISCDQCPSMAFIERAQAYPRQGASSGFSYGRAVGAIEATVALCQIPMILVEASSWKRRLHLPGKDKEAARQRALQLFPAQHALLARKKDHGRADAAPASVFSHHQVGAPR